MSDGKPCSYCRVGWMGRWRALLGGVWWIVYLCKSCGKGEQERA